MKPIMCCQPISTTLRAFGHLCVTLRTAVLLTLSIFAIESLAATQDKADTPSNQQVSDQFAPESSTPPPISATSPQNSDYQQRSYRAKDFILATANPIATQTGYDVLKKGGNAIDAMVAVQAVLGLVEPQSSGLGGGAFTLYYDAITSELSTYDGRETAPLEANENLFIAKDSKPMAFFDAVVGGRSVGTPGTVKLLWSLHQQKGRLPWASLLEPAIKLANAGFSVSPRLANALKSARSSFIDGSTAQRYFFPNGQAFESGSNLRNPEYAQTLKLLAQNGGDYFYNPEFAQAIVDKVRQHSKPGTLNLKDFLNYRMIRRPAICSPYHQYLICGMGPPSSGAITVNQILGILAHRNFKALAPESADAWHQVAEASRLAFADRGRYIADTDFIAMPSGLLDDNYLKQRSELISPKQAATTVEAGTPPNFETSKYISGTEISQPSTSHFVIVDADKNVISMTSTIENGFGSRLMVNGFLLNNELTDFSFSARNNNGKVANRVQPGKRPRSSMAPTIVFKDHKPVLAIGSPGGSRIINYVTNSLIRILDWNVPLLEAINRPHLVNRFGTLDIEQGTEGEKLQPALAALGHKISVRDLNSGLHAVQFTGGVLLGAADFRREGRVMGQ